MDDLISRQAAINELSYCQTYLFDTRDHDKKISLEDAEYTIERLPSVDAVEVVRCKNCKHLFEDNGCPLRYFKTHLEDDFCSYGERKTDG